MGVANGFMSVKLNLVRIESMYDDCEREIVRASRSLLILIPRSHFTAPKSVSEYLVFSLSL